MIVVRAASFRQRLDGIEKMLSALGDIEAGDTGMDASDRSILFRVDAPGHGLATRAIFEYRERYRRQREGWRRYGYSYEYRPAPPPSRRAHHEHPPYGVHQHCRERHRPERHSHYGDHERLLEATHEELVRLHLGEREIDCGGLRPLARARDRG